MTFVLKRLIPIGATIVAAVVGIWLLQEQTPELDQRRSAVTINPQAHKLPAPPDNRGVAYGQIQRQMQSMQEQLLALAEQMRQLDSAEINEDQRGNAPELSAEEAHAEQKRWQEHYVSNLDAAFSDQGRDPDWSPEAESQIRAALALLSDSGSISVECRAGLCRGEIVHEHDEGHEEILSAVRESFTWAGPAAFSSAERDGVPITQVYLAKVGEDLPTPGPMPTQEGG